MDQVHALKINPAVALGRILYLGFSGKIILNMTVIPVQGRLAFCYYGHLEILLFPDHSCDLLLVYAKTDPFLFQRLTHHLYGDVFTAALRPVQHHGNFHLIVRHHKFCMGVHVRFFRI